MMVCKGEVTLRLSNHMRTLRAASPNTPIPHEKNLTGTIEPKCHKKFGWRSSSFAKWHIPCEIWEFLIVNKADIDDMFCRWNGNSLIAVAAIEWNCFFVFFNSSACHCMLLASKEALMRSHGAVLGTHSFFHKGVQSELWLLSTWSWSGLPW